MTDRKQVNSILLAIQDAYIKRGAENIDALCNAWFGAHSAPLIIGAGSDEWFFGLEEAKKLFLADWASWGDFLLRLDTLKHEKIGTREWFALRAGVVYRFEDSPDTDALFLRLAREAAAKEAPPLARTGEILWLLSHLLHRRQSQPRKYLWHVTLSGVLEDTGEGAKLRSLQFALPANSLYPDERVGEAGWERECYETVGASIARWNTEHGDANTRWTEALSRFYERDSGISWLQDGQPRFIGLDGEMREAQAFTRELETIKSSWKMTLRPQNLVLSERDGTLLFYGLGLMERESCLEGELDAALTRIRADAYGEGEAALFRMRRDLSQILKQAGGGNIVASYRVEGMASIAGDALQMRYFHLSAPYCHVLEQKTDAAEEIE